MREKGKNFEDDRKGIPHHKYEEGWAIIVSTLRHSLTNIILTFYLYIIIGVTCHSLKSCTSVV